MHPTDALNDLLHESLTPVASSDAWQGVHFVVENRQLILSAAAVFRSPASPKDSSCLSGNPLPNRVDGLCGHSETALNIMVVTENKKLSIELKRLPVG